jgi:hypothetical protein
MCRKYNVFSIVIDDGCLFVCQTVGGGVLYLMTDVCLLSDMGLVVGATAWRSTESAGAAIAHAESHYPGIP